MIPWVIVASLAAYLLGSMPWGYWICRWFRRIDIRNYGSHNIGFTNVLRVVGVGPAFITLAGDITKGWLSVYLARQYFFNPEWSQVYILIVILAAMVGHGISLYFFVTERSIEGGKSVATGFGGLIGFSWQVAIICAITWFVTLAVFRYMSAASMVGALSFPINLWYFNADRSMQLVSVLAAGFIILKHLPNIQRLLDGREPKFLDKAKTVNANIPTCALYIHKIQDKDWEQSTVLRIIYRLLKGGNMWSIAEQVVERFCPPMYFGEINNVSIQNQPMKVIVVGVPLRPQTIINNNQLAIHRAIQAARLAKRLGANTIGLLGFNSVVGNGGQKVQQAMGKTITVTNGGALTAAVSKKLVAELIAQRLIPPQPVIGIIGSYGVVGSGIGQSLIYLAKKLILIREVDGKDDNEKLRVEKLLDRQKRELQRINRDALIQASTTLDDCHTCDILFIATSSPYPIIDSKHIKAGAVVVDFGRPPTVMSTVLGRNDFTLIRGGDIKIHGAQSTVDFGTGRFDELPACAVETILIGGLDTPNRQTLGQPTSDNMAFFHEQMINEGFQAIVEPLKRAELAFTQLE